LRVGGIEKLDQARKAPLGRGERQRATQRLVEVGALAGTEGRCAWRAYQEAQPSLEKFHVLGAQWQLQRVEARGEAVAQLEVLAAEGAHQDLKSMVFVENHLGGALCREQRDEKAYEHGLARAGRTADESVPGILAATSLRVGRIAGVEGEVVR